MAIESSLPEPQESGDSRFGAPGADNGDEISLIDLLLILAKRRRTILEVTAVFAIGAILASLLLPKCYTATLTLLPPRQNPSMGIALTSQLGGMAVLASDSSGLKNPNDRYVGMLTSATVENALVQDFGLMQEYHTRYLSDARKAFEHHVDVDGDSNSGIIHIDVEDRDPRRAAMLANGFVDQFQKLSEHLAFNEASQRRLFFEQQLKQAKNNLANAEETLKETEQTTGVFQLDSQVRALIESAALLRAQITAKEVQIYSMQTYATGNNPQLVEAWRELDVLRAQMAKLGGTQGSSDGLMVTKGQMPEASLEYVRKVRDLKYYETIVDILARQFEITKLDEAKRGALIQVVDAATPPDKPSFPKRGLIFIDTTIVGLLAGISIALASAGLEYLKSEHETNAKFLHLKRLLSWRTHSASRVATV